MRAIAKSTVFMCALAVAFLFSVAIVHANSMPPQVVWLRFEYKTHQRPHLDGVQIVWCETPKCDRIVLLQQWGKCNGVGCFSSSSNSTKWNAFFECAGEWCRSVFYVYSYDSAYFRLVVQLSGQVSTSNVTTALSLSPGRESYWRVVVQDSGLSVEQDAAPKEPGVFQFLGWLTFSLLVELFVAALYLRLWLKMDSRRLASRLLLVFLVNLVTFPVVWFFFPSLGQFQPDSSRKAGLLTVLITVIYSALLIGIYTSGKNRRRVIVGSIVSLPVTCACYLLLYLAFSYGDYTASAQGLPDGVILFMSEAFAVVYEAMLIAILSKQIISWKQAGVMSLLMNVTSFLLGLWLGRLWL